MIPRRIQVELSCCTGREIARRLAKLGEKNYGFVLLEAMWRLGGNDAVPRERSLGAETMATYTLRVTVEKFEEVVGGAADGSLKKQHKAVVESSNLSLKDTVDMQAPLLGVISEWLSKDEE